MPGRVVIRARRLLAVTAGAGAFWMLASSIAAADIGIGVPDPPAQDGGNWIGTQVRLDVSNNGSGERVAPAQTWQPAACWYEPWGTPEEYDEWWGPAQIGIDGGKATAIGEMEEFQNPSDYLGKEGGLWWRRVYNYHSYEDPVDRCPHYAYNVWVEETDDVPPNAITPEELSQIAYDATELPAPAVTLKPGPEEQVVNLPTHVSFDSGLARVWVTASIDYLGYQVAATTVATPRELTIQAGTEHAAPNTCTYPLSGGGGSGEYQLDTSGASCNITYLRRSADGYPLTAELVWDVHWTPSADPDGPPAEPALPDGLSRHEETVLVQEIQSIVVP